MNRDAGPDRMTGPEKREYVEGMRRRLADLLAFDPPDAAGDLDSAIAACPDLGAKMRGMTVGGAIQMDRLMRYVASQVSEIANHEGRTVPPKDVMTALIVLFLHAAPEGVSLEAVAEYSRDMKEILADETKRRASR